MRRSYHVLLVSRAGCVIFGHGLPEWQVRVSMVTGAFANLYKASRETFLRKISHLHIYIRSTGTFVSGGFEFFMKNAAREGIGLRGGLYSHDWMDIFNWQVCVIRISRERACGNPPLRAVKVPMVLVEDRVYP
jgi:hypothetical protein